MVAFAVRIRVCTGLLISLAAKPDVRAHHVERLRFAHLARQLLELAVGMRQLDRIAGFEEIQALPNAGQIADRREIGGVERHAPENRIQRVVAADHHFDRGGDAGLLNGNRRTRRLRSRTRNRRRREPWRGLPPSVCSTGTATGPSRTASHRRSAAPTAAANGPTRLARQLELPNPIEVAKRLRCTGAISSGTGVKG